MKPWVPLAIGLAAIAVCASAVILSVWAHHAAYNDCRAGGMSEAACVLRTLL